MSHSNRLGAVGRGPIGSTIGMAMAILAIMECVGPAVGQNVGPRIGSEVVLGSPDTELKVGPRVVATGRPHRLYRVGHVRGDWLWLVSGDVSGWVKQDEVVSFDQAMEDCNRAIETSSEAGWSYFRRGTLWLDKEQWARAVADFDQAIRQAPTDPAILLNRGLALSRLKDNSRAIADYSAAIQLDPKYGWAYESRGRAWAELGEYDRAVADYSEALQLDPGDVLALQGRALAWVKAGLSDGAIADLNEAIRLEPRWARAYTGRGFAWSSKHEYGRALADYDAALRLDPNDVDAYAGVATIRATCPDARHRDGRRAVAAAARALKLHGGACAPCLDTLAAAYAEAGDFDAAVKWEAKALEVLPKDDTDQNSFRSRLALYQDKKPYRDRPEGTANAIAVTPRRRDDGAR